MIWEKVVVMNDAAHISRLLNDFQCFLRTISVVSSSVGDVVPRLAESLENILVTTPRGEATIAIGGTDIAELRKSEKFIGSGRARLRIWSTNNLLLPLSGSVMDYVHGYLFQYGEGQDMDVSLLGEHLSQDDELLAEVIAETLNRDTVVDECYTDGATLLYY